jgi:non-canonical poly(A) RNA polymerase PAPD5/7
MMHDAAPAIHPTSQGTETPNGVPENSKKRRRRKNEDSTKKRQRVRERTKDSYRAPEERERLATAGMDDGFASPSALNSAVSAGEDGTPVASGSSTPFVKGTSTMDVNGKAQKAQVTGDRSEETSTTSTRKQVQGKETFEEGADFIAFVLSDKDEEEEEPGPSRRTYDRKGKGKEEVEVEVLDERALTDSREGKSRRDQGEDTRTSDRKGKSRARDLSPRRSEREWDRGKKREREDDERYERRNGSHKRKHDDYDDGYANKKQRLDAGSRKSPWVNGLDLDRCHNVAEM